MSDQFEIEKTFSRLDTSTAIAIEQLLVNKKPVEKSDVALPDKNVSAEVAYHRLLNERPDIKILTPKENYTNVSQKLHYRCKKCGNEFHERKDRLLPKRAGQGKPFQCKECKKIDKRYARQALILQKTAYYISQREGKILNIFLPDDKKRDYVIETDHVHICCKYGHEWVVSHKYLHSGAWCARCSAINGIEAPVAPFPNVKKDVSKELTFFALKDNARDSGMNILFPVLDQPDNTYFGLCLVCGSSAILTKNQLLRRKYLCLNRCQPSNMPSFTMAVFSTNFFVGDMTVNQKVLLNEYEKACQLYYEWFACKSIYPKPLGYKKDLTE